MAEAQPLVDLLRQVVDRVKDVVAAEERVRALLDSVLAVGGDLELHATLQRITASAAHLADARYAALGVIDREGEQLSDFITHGVDDEGRLAIGPPPKGHGILGLLITDPHPLRLDDLRTHPMSYGFPESHPPMRSFLGVPVRVRDRVFGNLYLTEKRGGGDFTDDDERAVVALAAAAGVAVENARLFDQTQRRERWLAATAEIQRVLLRHVDRDAALTLVCTRARDVTGADLALVVLDQDDGALCVEAVAGGAAPAVGTRLPRSGAIVDVVDRGATVQLAAGVSVAGVDGIESALIVPFTGPAGAGGALLVGIGQLREAAWPAVDDVQALSGFAAQAALALDRAQAQEDRAALAVFADRDRIARDLHDVVIQRLFAVGLSLQGAARRSGDAEIEQRVAAAVADLDTTIRDIRGAIFELGRDDAGTDLRGQLRDVVQAAAAATEAAPRVELRGPLDSAVPDELRLHLVAVLGEALSNAVRHSGAEQVSGSVAVERGQVVVEVWDDGRGIRTDSPQSGLANLRRRAESAGGSFTVSSEPGGGTQVRWVAPLEAPAVAEQSSGGGA